MTTISFVSVFVYRPAAGDHEFLQIFRAPNRYMQNTWQLVSGGIEPDEPAWQAALRELREETALTPLEFYTLDQVSTFYIPHSDTLAHSINFAALVPADSTAVLNDEHTASRWLPQSAFEPVLMWPGQRTAFREVLSEILQDSLSKPHLRIPLPQ